MNRRDFLKTTALVGAGALTTGFLRPMNRNSHTVSAPSADALDTLLASMSAGEWVKLNDTASQPTGLVATSPALSLANFAISGQEDDWDINPPGDDDGTGEDSDVLAAIASPAGAIKSWNSASVVDKTGHVQMYLCGCGGHANYGGNETYSFDILAAAASINGGGNGGVWVRRNDPARLGLARLPDNSIHRGYNPHNPYTGIQSGFTAIKYSPYDPANPSSTDQRHVGPLSTHTYGGHVYDAELDAILVYGGSAFRHGGSSGQGLWLWSIANQRWELLPVDHALGAGEQAVAGAFSLNDAPGTPTNCTLIKIASNKYYFGKHNRAFRVRFDGGTYSTNVLSAPNTMAQEIGTYSTPAGHSFTWGGAGSFAVGAPYERSSPPGSTSANLAAWSFSYDVGVDKGWVSIQPDIDQENTSHAAEYLEFANDIPNNGGSARPDFTTPVYSPSHDAFFFGHGTWQADFQGQIYKLDRSTMTWSTHVSGGSGSYPTQTDDTSDNGAYGKFAYLPGRNCFVYMMDSAGETGEVWLCKGP